MRSDIGVTAATAATTTNSVHSETEMRITSQVFSKEKKISLSVYC